MAPCLLIRTLAYYLVLWLVEFRVTFADSHSGVRIQTSSGLIVGHPAENASAVSEFLGVPYAKPPTGDLRFEAPQPFAGDGQINASAFGYSCPTDIPDLANATKAATQANITDQGLVLLKNFLEKGVALSEDCLTLNIWSKSCQDSTEKKAVMVWMYGGGFKNGVSSNRIYNGQHIADQEDVIVVSLNYRSNIFGFPGNPIRRDNLGLLDQRVAVEWVRDNIEQFGGDASRITLWGQSAGGVSADYWKYAYVDDPIVSSFILESGAANGIPSRTPESSAEAWFAVTSKLGCGNASSDHSQVLKCMKSKKFEDITKARGNLPGLGFIEGEYTPTADEIVVFSDYNKLSRNGSFIQKPTLTGNVIKEDGFLNPLVQLVNGATQPQSQWDKFTHQNFTCASAQQGNVSVSRGIPTWRYLYFGDYENIAITPESRAYHESELPLIFDTVPSEFAPSPPDEVLMGKYMRTMWTTFAKDPLDGLSKYWPCYDPAKPTLARLGFNNTAGEHLDFPAGYDKGCISFYEFPLHV